MSKRVVIAHLPWEGKDYLVHTLVEGERPVELTALCREKETLLGNIYVGRVEKLAPGIRGAFVSFAEQQSCFLDLSRVKGGYLLKKAPGTELHVGDEIVVQIQREAQKTKLPSATAELSLSGSALALYYGKSEISCSGRLLPEQKKRLNHLAGSEDTSWRVKEKDWKNNENYDKCFSQFDTMLVQTDTANAPWTIVEAMDKKFAVDKILTTIVNGLEQAVEKNQKKGNPETDSKSEDTDAYLQNSVLKGVDLTLSLKPEEYKKKKKDLQKRMEKLHNQMYLQRVPVVLAFEGWDAGGKGGAIKRITQCMDARGYEVVPIASPNDIEKAHHYLWRFWNHFPKDGHMAIFDRTWYGRVLVERVEGFATEEEWKRAYQEINDMEAHLVKSGTIVLKFWMHIDKDEQEKRFKQRMETPEKQWKITDEDWRNRDKWDDYEKAVDEMMLRTSTTEAPWHIIEANSKLYARIKVLEIVVEALEKRLE